MGDEQHMQNPTHVQQLGDMLRGYFLAQALHVAARLGVADLLARDAASPGVGVDALARATGVHEDSLYRMLRALSSEGVFEELPQRRFRLNDMGELLRSDVAGSMRPAALLAGETQYKVWTAFKETVKSGSPAFDRIFRQSLFPFLEGHPDVAALFQQVMSQHMAHVREQLLAACEARAGETIVDVGGGTGDSLVALLERHAEARGVLFEQASVVAGARDRWKDHAVARRIEWMAGDFLKGGLPRGQVMVLSWIVHMFQDDEAERILRNCRAAIAVGGRIYLAEQIVKDPNVPDAAKWDDLNMMVMTGGRERTLQEFRGLLEAAGFTAVRQAAEGIVAAVA
jgi:hypothetical protein